MNNLQRYLLLILKNLAHYKREEEGRGRGGREGSRPGSESMAEATEGRQTAQPFPCG